MTTMSSHVVKCSFVLILFKIWYDQWYNHYFNDAWMTWLFFNVLHRHFLYKRCSVPDFFKNKKKIQIIYYNKVTKSKRIYKQSLFSKCLTIQTLNIPQVLLKKLVINKHSKILNILQNLIGEIILIKNWYLFFLNSRKYFWFRKLTS